MTEQKLPPVTAFCYRCHTTRELINPRQLTYSKSEDIIVGECSVCGHEASRVVKHYGK